MTNSRDYCFIFTTVFPLYEQPFQKKSVKQQNINLSLALPEYIPVNFRPLNRSLVQRDFVADAQVSHQGKCPGTGRLLLSLMSIVFPQTKEHQPTDQSRGHDAERPFFETKSLKLKQDMCCKRSGYSIIDY